MHPARDADLVLLSAAIELPARGPQRRYGMQRQHDVQLRVLWSHGVLSKRAMDMAVRLRVNGT